MYCIYYDDEVVYDPFSPEEYAFNVTCNGGVNDKGGMRFSVGYGHRMYKEFKVRQGLIKLTYNDDVIFAGYIDQIEKNFNLDLEITCYGILGYLGDILLRPYTTYQDDEGQFVLPSTTELFKWYIDEYNKKATHRFIIGYNEGNDIYNGNIFRSNTSISSVGSELESQLISTVGGYVSTRIKGESWYIDYKKEVGDVNSQIIDFGVNLLDYTYIDSASGIYTAVVVTGGTDEQGNEITIKPVIVETDGNFYYNEDTITAIEAAAKYGYIETHYNNTDAETPQQLLEAAIAYLKIVSKPSVSIVCKAIDMALYMDGYKHLAVGEIVRVRSYPHDIDEYMVVTEIDVDLDNPQNTEYTLGVVYDTLTGEQLSKLKDLNDHLDRTVDSVEGLGQDILDAAEDAKNALDKSTELEKRFESSEFERSEFEQAIKDSILDLQKIADGAIETWFFPYSPTNDKEPTVNWETDDEKYNHIGDLFYNTETGKAFRWMYAPNSQGVMEYSWGPIIDTDIEAALKEASIAKDTADSKRRVFYDTPYPPYDEGDLWAQGYGGDILMSTVDRPSGSFNPDDWVYAAKYSKAVYSTEEQFYQSDSPTELVGGLWTTENTWVDGKYTWRRTLITYGNGDQEFEPSAKGVCITGNTGDDGVGILSVDVEYYLSRYSDRLAGDIWHTDPPDFIEGRYMWSRTKVVYTDGRIEYTPSEDGACIAVSGTEGSNGIGISYFEEQYIRTKSNSTVPGDKDPGWSSKYPGWVEGEFLWTRTIIHYSDGSTSMTYPICVSGIQGEKGDKGTGVLNVDVEYYLSRSSTSLVGSTWVTDPPQWVEGRYMWTKTITYYTDGTKEETEPVCIALSGKDGSNGLSISYMEEQYFQSASNTTVPGDNESGWTSKYPGVSTSKPYIWTRTVIHYSDGSTSMTYPVCVTGPKGDKGTDGQTSYFHVKYSDVANPTTASQMKDTPAAYIGTYVDFNQTASTDPKKYQWIRLEGIPGENGIPGVNGTNGKTSYLHIAYANSADGKTGFSVSDSTNKLYIGQYTDFEEKDSTDPTKYTWTRIKGDTGAKGDTGNGISSIVEHYLATMSASGVNKNTPGWSTDITTQVLSATKKYLWNYTTTNYTNGTSVDTTPAIIGVYGDKGDKGDPGKDGTNGTNGKDGMAFFGKCDTGAETPAKVCNGVSGFSLKDGVTVSILFKKGNTAASPTLNVNSSGALPLMTNGLNFAYWTAEQTILVTYYESEKAWYVASHPVWANQVTVGNSAARNVFIDSNSVNFRNGSTANATFKDSEIHLAQANSQADIFFAQDNVRITGAVSDGGVGYQGQFVVGNESETTNSLRLIAKNGSSVDKTSYLNLYTFNPTSSLYGTARHAFDVNLQGDIPLSIAREYNETYAIFGYSGTLSQFTVYTGTANIPATTTNIGVIYSGTSTINIGSNSSYATSNVYFGSNTNVYKNYRPMYGGTKLDSSWGGTTLYLSESAANFTMMDIYYTTNNNTFDSLRVYNPNGKYVTITATNKSSYDLYLKNQKIYISGDQISVEDGGEINVRYPSQVNYNNTVISIQAVVGWK